MEDYTHPLINVNSEYHAKMCAYVSYIQNTCNFFLLDKVWFGLVLWSYD